MVKLDKFLQMLNFLIHFRGNIQWLFLLPLPQTNLLLGWAIGLAEGDNHGAIFVDVQGHNTIGVGIEDCLAGGAGCYVPDYQHGVVAGVRGHYYVEFFVVGCCGNLVALKLARFCTWPCSCLWRLFS